MFAGLLGVAAVGPVPVVAAVGLLVVGRVRRRRRAAQRAATDVVSAVAESAELLVAAVTAGLTPHAALARTASALPAPASAAVEEVLRRARHGERLSDALDRLPALLGEPARPLARALATAERHGTALAPALELLGVEARAERRRRAEEAARRLPVRLSFPLVCCFLPALALCTVVPLLAGTLATLRL
jgi:tight adherence protein C